MRNIDELLKNNIAREDMTEEEEYEFVKYWFEKYTKAGFCKTFHSPFDLREEDKPYIGKPFKVLCECDTKMTALDNLPMWGIEFEDGHIMYAYPEEICLLEYEDASDTCVKTSAGVITTQVYNDGMAKGLQVLLNGEIVCMLDVYESVAGETEGEARVLVYKNNEDEPSECITVNR